MTITAAIATLSRCNSHHTTPLLRTLFPVLAHVFETLSALTPPHYLSHFSPPDSAELSRSSEMDFLPPLRIPGTLRPQGLCLECSCTHSPYRRRLCLPPGFNRPSPSQEAVLCPLHMPSSGEEVLACRHTSSCLQSAFLPLRKECKHHGAQIFVCFVCGCFLCAEPGSST